jgi:hypothetical protein
VADATRDLAFMQLARIHYGARQNRYALYYYAKIERGKPQWLEALFESAWANYRIGQYEQALGNLITLSSPFFRDEYFPEALILKAVIYYENCRYASRRRSSRSSSAATSRSTTRWTTSPEEHGGGGLLRGPRRHPDEEPGREEGRARARTSSSSGC